MENVKVFCHSSIKLSYEDVSVYIDPYKVPEEYHDADIILITHTHYDHFSEEDIDKVRNENTIIVATLDARDKIKEMGFIDQKVLLVEPNKKYKVNEVSFSTIPAYNVNKAFHKKEYGWVGYIVTLDGVNYYIAGDTDINDENRAVDCDIAFLPVGGTYTMNATEAASLANEIKPKIVIPIHYGLVVGSKEDVEEFRNILNPSIKCIDIIGGEE